jgi:hypothetical protein
LNHDGRALEYVGAKDNTVETDPFIVMPKAKGADRFHGLIKIGNHAVIVLKRSKVIQRQPDGFTILLLPLAIA